MMSFWKASQEQHLPALRALAGGFLLGLPAPILGTWAVCAGAGNSSLAAMLAAQLHSPKLHIADMVPFVLALLAYLVRRRSQAHAARAGRTYAARAGQTLAFALLALTILPMSLLLYARREDAQAVTQFADVNVSGSLRFRSVWLYGAGQPGAHVSLAKRKAQRDSMRAILVKLSRRYPAEVAATDVAWQQFQTDFGAQGQVDWAGAFAMRDAADRLTQRIERKARAEAQQASELLLWGIVGLGLSGMGSLILLRRLRQAENTLHKLGSILDTAPDFIGMSDPQGRLVYLNKSFREFFCLPDNAELPRMSVADLHTPQSREVLETQSRPAALAQGRWEGTATLLHPTRGEIPVSQTLQAHRSPDGVLDVFFTVIRDVSQHHAVETALQEAEALFRSAISAMQEGFLVQDRQGSFLMANQCAEEILGLTRDPQHGRLVMRPNWRAVYEDGTPFAREDHPSQRTLRTGQPHSDIIMGVDQPGQPRQWLTVSAAPLFHAGETVPHAAVTTFSDITAQKAADDDLRQAEERLRTVVGNAPMILFSLNAEGAFTTLEGRGLELLGTTSEEGIGRSLFEVVDNDPVICSNIRRALAGEEVSYTSHSAGYIWDNQCRPLLGPHGVEGVIGIAFDVTDRHQVEEARRRGGARLRRLYEITADAELSFTQKTEQLMQMGCDEFGLETGTLAKIDKTLFEVIQSYAVSGAGMEGVACDPQSTFCQIAFTMNEPLGIEDVGHSEWSAHPAYHIWKVEAYLGTQVCIGDQPFGTLCFSGMRPHPVPFTPADKDLLRLMAQWLGGEMQRRQIDQQMHDYNVILEFQKGEMERANRELEQANAQLATLAATDGLTGLCNRRALTERLAEEMERAQRYHCPLSVILLDVDHFKQYNDTFGHPAGDGVLRVVGQMLRDQARSTDVAARYGGEEFAVVLPETDATGALVVAERIRATMESRAWPLRSVTVSVGVCTLNIEIADSEALLAAADHALYQSKAAGRNRVTHAASANRVQQTA